MGAAGAAGCYGRDRCDRRTRSARFARRERRAGPRRPDRINWSNRCDRRNGFYWRNGSTRTARRDGCARPTGFVPGNIFDLAYLRYR